LVVGDPLCRPWAAIPKVDAVLAADGEVIAADRPLSGRIELLPRATVAGPRRAGGGDAALGGIDRFVLFVDGVRLAECRPGERLPLDTAQLADGHHELRVVAVEQSSVRSQGRLIMPVRFANHGKTLALAAEPTRVRVSGTVRVSVSGTALDGVAVYAMGRVLGRTAGGDTTIEVPAALLGRGRVTLRATGRSGVGAANGVNADPVTIEVTE
ncbi:MAG: hypothetical protein ACKO6B_14620, partial [Planctomycetia bacterium]